MGEEFRCEKRRVSSDTEKQLSVASLEFPAQENPCPTPRCARRRTGHPDPLRGRGSWWRIDSESEFFAEGEELGEPCLGV